MSKKLVLVIPAILLATTIYLYIVHDGQYTEYIRNNTVDPGFDDLWPRYLYGMGRLVIVSCAATIISCLAVSIYLWPKKQLKSIKPSPIFLLLILLPTAISLNFGHTNTTINHKHENVRNLYSISASISTELAEDGVVDILYAGDEEFMSFTEPWPVYPWFPYWTYDRPSSEIVEQEYFPELQGCFYDQLGINIEFHGWASWDSRDDTNDRFDMLQEAISEISGVWVVNASYPDGGYWQFNRGMTYNGAVVDILVCFTLQEMDGYGLGPYGWHGAIVYYVDGARAVLIPEHEISHLYNCRHCTEVNCIMNGEYAFFTDDWQPNCKNYMLQHTEDFTRHVLTVNGAIHGTTDVSPGQYYHYHGSSVTITASPYLGYSFSYWSGVDASIMYNNPLELTIESSCEITPIFVGNSTSTVGGFGGGRHTKR